MGWRGQACQGPINTRVLGAPESCFPHPQVWLVAGELLSPMQCLSPNRYPVPLMHHSSAFWKDSCSKTTRKSYKSAAFMPTAHANRGDDAFCADAGPSPCQMPPGARWSLGGLAVAEDMTITSLVPEEGLADTAGSKEPLLGMFRNVQENQEVGGLWRKGSQAKM